MNTPLSLIEVEHKLWDDLYTFFEWANENDVTVNADNTPQRTEEVFKGIGWMQYQQSASQW